ncbi:peptidyl-prolyl isomerase PASTICCINO1 [Klebsormidium nitens]|uniref:peptidylprolyl isomerase n=1 Tax=Klebsormidium nitens TaxID=105231 RepID=A0A1Y1ICB6_KLENI|nr:peptidyl-prolyl isomerase PASTICCINO1 [Klebsormidium nitens]|eukprot:GAQ88614.1 peptidyl-prolyl isomerase PASTICCINO1 [Klebsormidium nitens]
MEDEVPSYQEKKKRKPLREIPPGGVLKAVIRGGQDGVPGPREGQQVILHYVVRRPDDTPAVLESTRKEFGGTGTPRRFLLGNEQSLWAWEFAVPSMRKGEIAMLKVQPEYHYGDKQCPWSRPEHIPSDEQLLFEIELLDYMDVKVLTEDGNVVKQVLSEGDGWENPRPPYEVTVQARGVVSGMDTAVFPASEPLEFAMGSSKVPRGLETALQNMLVKEKARVWVAGPEQLEPRGGAAAVPAGADEIDCTLELLSMNQVRDVMGDGEITKRRLVHGEGDFPMDCPLEDSTLAVHVTGRLPDGTVFWDTHGSVGGGESAPLPEVAGQPYEFATGEGLVPEGLESSIRLMLKGERAIIHSSAKYAYDKFPRPGGVPEGSPVVWEVELVSFEKVRNWTDLDMDAVLQETVKTREQGNRLFKQGKFKFAKEKYLKILRQLKRLQMGATAEQAEAIASQRVALQLNLAAVHHKMEEYAEAVKVASEVLSEDPGNAKALFRRAQAYTMTGDFEEAERDYRDMLAADPSTDADAKAGVAKIRRREQEYRAKAKQQFGGMLKKRPGALSDQIERFAVDPKPGPAASTAAQEREDAAEVEGEISRETQTRSEGLLETDRRGSWPWPNLFRSLRNRFCTIL